LRERLRRGSLDFDFTFREVRLMTRKQLEDVIAQEVPYQVNLADGRSHAVPHPDYISLPPKNATVAIVYEDDGTVHLLPLLTMTGLTYRPK
jgi:hypothetical protein